MPRKSALRAVDSPVRASAGSVSSAAASGDHRQLLIAMRDRLAVAVSDPDCPPKDLAPLVNRLAAVAKDLAQMDATDPQPMETVDDSYDPAAI